jgi:uncharacterized membrane protein
MGAHPCDPRSGLLTVRLGRPGEAVDLVLFEQLAERLRSAFREIVREHSRHERPQVRLLIRDAQKGSIVLMVEPQLEGADVQDVSQIARTLIEDINALGQQRARPDMAANLFGHYREMVRIAEQAGGLEMGFDGSKTIVGPGEQIAFQTAVREQPEAGVEIVGTIETVNIHGRPWTFGLYTKLDRQRVECRFPDSMLETILRLMDARTLVCVQGEGRFAMAGITPRSLEVTEAPVGLQFVPETLRAYRRSSEIAHEWETASAATMRIREERVGFA